MTVTFGLLHKRQQRDFQWTDGLARVFFQETLTLKQTLNVREHHKTVLEARP